METGSSRSFLTWHACSGFVCLHYFPFIIKEAFWSSFQSYQQLKGPPYLYKINLTLPCSTCLPPAHSAFFLSLLLVISTQLLHVLLVLVFLHLKQMLYGTFNVYCNHSPEKGFSCMHLISTVQNLLNITSMHFFFACSVLQNFFVIYCCRFWYESLPSVLDFFLHSSSEKTLFGSCTHLSVSSWSDTFLKDSFQAVWMDSL